MTLLYDNPRFLEHDTGQHPERAERLRAIRARLEAEGLYERCNRPDWKPIDAATFEAVHERNYWQAIEELAARGGGHADEDTVVSPESPGVAQLGAGAACDAVRRVGAGEERRALCLIRPPGHHALADQAMGFCLINNAAAAARLATDQLGMDRVLVVDWDVHHGNGTQALFYSDGRVGYFSAHRHPFYPGTGAADETGAGDGLGATLNLPVQFGTSRDRYLSWFVRELGDFADRIKPQLVLISAGFDAHREDPVGSLGLETEDFSSLTAAVMDVAAAHAEGRLVSVLEGGYNPPVLAHCVALHLEELLERDREESPSSD